MGRLWNDEKRKIKKRLLREPGILWEDALKLCGIVMETRCSYAKLYDLKMCLDLFDFHPQIHDLQLHAFPHLFQAQCFF